MPVLSLSKGAPPDERRRPSAPEVRLEEAMLRSEYEEAERKLAEASAGITRAIAQDKQVRTTESRFAVLDSITQFIFAESEMNDLLLGDCRERLERIERLLGMSL